jgi:arginine decarboxylase
MNYTLQEYARDVVYNVLGVCESEKVAHPTIVSESGRAIVAHHSVLVVEAFSSIEKGTTELALEIKDSDPKLLHEMVETQKGLTKQNRMEVLHDTMQIRDQCQSMFELGLLDLEIKAKIEIIYWQVAQSVVELCRGMRYVPDEVKELETSLGDQYLCNFSVFQSLLDHWALGQLFPIMPIHHLEQPPDRNATLADITCDSDGKVGKFIDLQDVKDTLPLHRIQQGQPYYLGFFLMGAYQDIMGDLHNLFGRVNEVHVFLDEDEESGWYIEEVIEGSTVGSVLSMTQWNESELIRLVKAQVDAAIKSDRLKPNEAMRLLSEYERALKGYTYLNFQNGK